MSLAFKLTREAEDQLQHIYLYGLSNWNEHVADEYHQGFFDAFKRITLFPKAGVSAEEHVQGLRKKRHGKHNIYYSIHPGYVLIEKVVHTARNIRPHFDDL